MYSQSTRIFSQGGEISQLSDPLSSQQCGTDDDYNAVLSSQNEEPLSARVDAICEQNRQLRGFLEKDLKPIEKKRLKLTNKKSEIEDQIKIYVNKHKHQNQKSVEFQMNIEELAEKYHNELNQRKNITEKLNNTQIFVDYFMDNHSEMSKVTADLENTTKDLTIKFENLYTILKVNAEEKSELKSYFQSQMQEKFNIAQQVKDHLMKERKTCTETIQSLVIQDADNKKKLNCIQEEILLLKSKKTKLKDLYNELTLQNKLMKEETVKQHKELDELKSAHALDVQNLKLQINNEKNKNSNLQIKEEEYKTSINTASTKKNELVNLFSQMSLAIEETTKRLDEKKKEFNECKNKKEAILNEIQILQEGIKNCENAPNTNTLLNDEICKIKVSNNQKEQSLLERQHSVEKNITEQSQLKDINTDKQANIHELKTKLIESLNYQNELCSKLEKDRTDHQLEREAKISENKTLQKMNMDITGKVNNLNHDVEDSQVVNNKVKSEMIETRELIDLYKKLKAEADKKLKVLECEWEENCKASKERFDQKENKLNNIEDSIIEAKPYQDELAILLVRKETLKQKIQQQNEKYSEVIESLKRDFNSKFSEISGEADNYTCIMEGIIKADIEAAEKLKEEIKRADELRINLEADLNKLFLQIKKLRNEEQMKRNKVVKLEKKLKTINKEIKFTRQDISDAVTGNVQTSHRAKLATQSSSPDLLQKFREPPLKKMTLRPNMSTNENFSQIKTKQWLESSNLHQDDYEFSEI